MFVKISVLKISQYLQEKTCVGVSFKKTCNFTENKTVTQVFSYEYLPDFNIFFYKAPPVAM